MPPAKQQPKRASRKSSPAAAGTGSGGKLAKATGRRQSRSKSASPSATTAKKPRSRSSSRTRQPQQQQPSPPDQKKQSAVKRQPTPSRQRRGAAAGENHSGGAESSATVSTTTTTVVSTRSATTSSSVVAANVATVASSVSASPVTPPSFSSAVATSTLRQSRSEFCGAFGASLMTVGLPVTLILVCLISDGRVAVSSKYPFLSAGRTALSVEHFFSLRASLMYLGWLAIQLALYCLPIGGRWVNHEGGRYHCNGLFALVVSVAGFALATWWGLPAARVLCQEATRMAVFACLFSWLLAALLFARSHRLPATALTAEAAAEAAACGIGGGGGCRTAVYEFFMGRELHPRLFRGLVDLKFFLELRPGLIGWAILDLAFAYQASTNTKGLGSPLAHLTFMHLLYIADALFFERSILTTTDIKREGLGFMLAFGNLAWVPFFYSLSARQLVTYSPTMPVYCLVGVELVNIFGYWLFRFANRQKDLYRSDPHHPTFVGCRSVPTGVRGHNLLADGFWGRLRHPNFTGDLIMAAAWSLAAGLHAPLAWLYPPYLLGLLVHRALRDESHCAKKYGVAWQRYCELVPRRLVPWVY